MQRPTKPVSENPKKPASLDIDLLLSLVANKDDAKNPSINLTKLDYVLRNFSIFSIFIYLFSIFF